MNHYQSLSAAVRARRIRWLSVSLAMLAAVLWSQMAAAAAQPGSPQTQAQQAARDFSRGQFEDAVQGWHAAAAAYAESGDGQGEIQALLGEGNAYLALGRHRDAIAVLEHAQARAKAVADPALVAVASAALGNGYLLTGQTDEAGTLLSAAISEARAIGRWDVAARAGNDQGSRLASIDRPGLAIEAYQDALQDGERADDRLTVAKIRVNLARALQAAERSDDARVQLAQALNELHSLPSSHEQAYAIIAAGRLYAARASAPMGDQGDRLLANQAFEAAAASAEVSNDQRALSYALGYQAELYEQAGRSTEALRLAQQASSAAQKANAPESLFRWQWAVGRLFAGQNEIGPAIESYTRAVYTLNAIRPDLVGGYQAGQGSFRQQVGPLFLQLADLELQQAVADPDAAKREAGLRRVRETVEALKGVELADYFQDDCVAALKSKTVGIDKLAAHTGAIYPIIFEDRIELLVSLPSGTKLYTTRVPSAEVEKVVRGFRSALERRITHQYRRPARQVYDWLIRPLEADLAAEKINTLVIVPDGVLRSSP